MAYTNIEEAIIAVLDTASWTLATPIARAEIHFTTGWYDSHKSEYPQVTCSYLYPRSDDELFFGSATDDDQAFTISREVFAVNCWYRVPSGKSVGNYSDYIEQMRNEVHKLLKDGWKGFTLPAGISAVLPLNRGTPLHDTTRQTRMLRVEIEVQVNIIKS